MRRGRLKPSELRRGKKGLKRSELARGPGPKRNTGIGRSQARMKRRPQPTTGYRLWVRATQVCAVPGCRRSSPDPHHVRARGMGRSADPWKEDERNVCPLCRRHHQQGDSPGWSWKRFEREVMGRELQEIAEELWTRWMELPEETRRKWEGRAYRLNVRRGVPKARASRRDRR